MIDFLNTRLTAEGIRTFYGANHEMPFKFAALTRSQADMAKAIGTMVPDKRVFLSTSGNGSGKSAFAINLILNIIFPNVNIYRNIVDEDDGKVFSGFFDYPLFNNFPSRWPKNIWYVSNAEALKAIWQEFEFWVPKSLYKASKDHKGYISLVKFKGTSWTLFFKTIDQEPKTFESANISVMIFDEPPPRKLYHAAGIRLRKGGFIVIPATPLFGAGWFMDEIVDPARDSGSDKFHQKVPVWSNCIEKAGDWDLGVFGVQKKGNLHDRDIQVGLSICDPDERKAREFGEFGVYTGRVFKTYNREIHFRDLKATVDPHTYQWQFVLDPHDRKPPAAVWIRVDSWGRKMVYREWPAVTDDVYRGLMFHKIKSAEPYVIKDFVGFFVEILRELGAVPDRVQAIIDPNFGNKPNSVTGKIMFEEYEEEFRKQGFPIAFVTNCIDDIGYGIQRVRDLLKPTTAGDYYLLVDKCCKNVDYGFRNWLFDEWEGKTGDKKGLKEGVQDKDKDFPDLIRYASVTPFTWMDLPRERDPYSGTDYDEYKPKSGWRKKFGVARPAGVEGV